MNIENISLWGKKIIIGILIIVVGRVITFIIARTIGRIIIRQQGDTQNSHKAAQIIEQIIHIIIMAFVILFAIQSVGFNVALIIGGMTFAIGYAMQETLGNLMAGLLLLTNPKYKLGLLMEFLGDIQVFGTLENITLRNSIIRGFDKQATIIPNMTLLQTPMKTFKMENLVRYKMSINIQRQASFTHIQNILKEVVNKHKYVIQKEYTTVLIDKFTKQGTQLAIYFFFNPQCGYSSFKTRSELRHQIHEVFKNQNIIIPYPKILLETSKLKI